MKLISRKNYKIVILPQSCLGMQVALVAEVLTYPSSQIHPPIQGFVIKQVGKGTSPFILGHVNWQARSIRHSSQISCSKQPDKRFSQSN